MKLAAATLALAWAALLPVAAAAAPPLAAARALVERLTRDGRAEAALEQSVAEGEEPARTERGRLALEPPDRLRLDFTRSGERLTMRKDGGEWLQPATRQVLILRPEQAQAAVSLWRTLLEGGGDHFAERRMAPRRYRWVSRGEAGQGPDSLEITLGSSGLPARIVAWAGDVRWSFALSRWSFGRARGSEAFVVRAPAGYEVFQLP